MNNWKFENFEPLKFFPTLKKTFNLPPSVLTKIMKKGWLPQAGLPWNPPGSHLGSVGRGTNLPWLRCRNDINRNPSTWPRAPRHGLDPWDVGCRWVWPFLFLFKIGFGLFFGNRKINFPICRYGICIVYIYIWIYRYVHTLEHNGRRVTTFSYNSLGTNVWHLLDPMLARKSAHRRSIWENTHEDTHVCSTPNSP